MFSIGTECFIDQKNNPHLRYKYCSCRALLYRGERWKSIVYSLCQLWASHCSETTANISFEGSKFQFSELHTNLYVDWISSCDNTNKRDVNIFVGFKRILFKHRRSCVKILYRTNFMLCSCYFIHFRIEFLKFCAVIWTNSWKSHILAWLEETARQCLAFRVTEFFEAAIPMALFLLWTKASKYCS